jgi:acylphosphatase
MTDTSRRTLRTQGRQLCQEDRRYIFGTVSALVSVQFNELAFSLAPPPGVIPKNGSQGEKTSALLEWVESPTGPGLEAVDNYLQSIVPSDGKSFVAITIPVDIHSLTYEQKIKLAESIEEITGVKVNLLEEGSIRVIASGSEEQLRRLQQVFESGELSQV